MKDTYRWRQSPGSPPMTYAHSASISSGSSRSSHGGILRFPLATESTKRAWALLGKSRRLIAHCGLRIRVPWQVAQWRANRAAPFVICSGGNCGTLSCAAAIAQTNASTKLPAEKTFMCPCDRSLTSVRHQRKGPHRPTRGDSICSFHGPIDNAAYARKYRHVLPALVGVGDGRRIDAGTGLEFPQRFSRRLVQGDELAVEASSEQQTAIGREHAGGNHSSGHWHFPFRLAGHRIKRHVIAP